MNVRESNKSDISGWLNINKESNISSAKVVAIVKKLTGAKKVGHAGTLDPMATGVLPIALGAATKTVRFVMNGIKQYEFEVKWGAETDTDDIEGNIIKKSSKRPTSEEIIKSINKFTGEIVQVPPKYSAIKVNGVRSYKIARKFGNPILKSRKIYVKKLELLKYIDSDSSKFFLECEKGVYVRSIARDLAQYLGTNGHVSKLCRLSVNKFYYKDAILLADLSKLVDKSVIIESIMPISRVLDDIPAFEIDKVNATKISNGQKIYFNNDYLEGKNKLEEIFVTYKNNPMAIARYENGVISPKKVF